jgi:hypothetical protein
MPNMQRACPNDSQEHLSAADYRRLQKMSSLKAFSEQDKGLSRLVLAHP